MTRKPFPGKNLQLTIDLDLQAVAELTLENRRGAVVALDPRTGEVLAMVSRPAFDPNLFAGRIRSKDWKVLLDNPDHPLLNRAIQAQQAPGSTFKPIMALAGLETGVIDDNFHISCPGGATFYGRFFKCWGKHGTVGLHEGLVHSCDTFFYNVGNRLGIDRIASTPRWWATATRPGSICRTKPKAWCLPANGRSATSARNGIRRNHLGGHRPGRNHGDAVANGGSRSVECRSAGMWFQPHLVKDAVR
jgi:cell division protein FtsI/penicillin-binding protein 2